MGAGASTGLGKASSARQVVEHYASLAQKPVESLLAGKTALVTGGNSGSTERPRPTAPAPALRGSGLTRPPPPSMQSVWRR